MYKQTNDIIVTVESYESEYSKKKTSISLFKMKKTTVKKKKEIIHSINFEFELFNGYFEDTKIKYLGVMIYVGSIELSLILMGFII